MEWKVCGVIKVRKFSEHCFWLVLLERRRLLYRWPCPMSLGPKFHFVLWWNQKFIARRWRRQLERSCRAHVFQILSTITPLVFPRYFPSLSYPSYSRWPSHPRPFNKRKLNRSAKAKWRNWHQRRLKTRLTCHHRSEDCKGVQKATSGPYYLWSHLEGEYYCEWCCLHRS